MGQYGLRYQGTLPLEEALQQGQVLSSVQLIKVLRGMAPEVERVNLRAMIVNALLCFEALSEVLDFTADTVASWVEEFRQGRGSNGVTVM